MEGFPESSHVLYYCSKAQLAHVLDEVTKFGEMRLYVTITDLRPPANYTVKESLLAGDIIIIYKYKSTNCPFMLVEQALKFMRICQNSSLDKCDRISSEISA